MHIFHKTKNFFHFFIYTRIKLKIKIIEKTFILLKKQTS